jgi:hypothetical protein
MDELKLKQFFFFRILDDKLNKIILGKDDACDFFDAFGLTVQGILFILTMIVLLCK